MKMKKYRVLLRDGQELFYRVYGGGSHTLLLLHGLVGGSRLSPDWIDAIAKSGVRVIAAERPGYGDSGAVAMASVADFMDMARALAEQAAIVKADVAGCSAGAPYAYATALALPELIQRVYILDGVPAVCEDLVFRHYGEPERETYQGFLRKSQSELQEYYREQLQKATVAAAPDHVRKTVAEILARDCFGMAQESRLQILPWQLPLAELRQPITLYHAVHDEVVPYEAAREMDAFFRDCVFCDVDETSLPQSGSIHQNAIGQGFKAVLETCVNAD